VGAVSGRACPQALYTSASRTLEGPGFGVYAHSADWPAEVGRTRKALGALVGSRPEDGEAYGVFSRGAGRVLHRAVAARADGFGRPGNYLVHLLWDGSGRLGVRELLALRRAGRFLDALPEDAAPTADLPPLRVAPADRVAPVLAPDEVDALTPPLAGLLATLAAGSGRCALPARTASGREVAEVLFAVLPRALTAGVSLSTGTGEDDGDTAPVAVQLTDAPARTAATTRDTERARTLLEAASKGELAPDELADVRRLDVWLFADSWSEQDAAGLSAGQVAGVLESSAAPRWLARGGNAAAALDSAADSPAVEAALRAAVDRWPAVAGLVRDRVLAALLDEVLDGGPGPAELAVEVAGIGQADLCAALAGEVRRGRRIARLDRAAGLLVEQALGLGVDLPLLGLTGQTWELALLATRRTVVGDALVAQWRSSGGWTAAHGELLGHLLVADPGWLARLGDVVPVPSLPPALRWAALRMDVAGVEELAAAVATGAGAGRGWALREVVFGSELPAGDVDRVLGRRLELLLVDDGWPPELARSFARSRGGEGASPRRRLRRGDG
jgi:GTPase-associated protein 1